MSWDLALADCHEWLETLPDGSVDLVCCDPPYHLTNLAFDALEVRWAELWPLIYRKCKPSAVQVMSSAQPFTTDLIVSNRKRFRYELIWPKTMATGHLNVHRRPLQSHEAIIVFSASQGAYNPQMGTGKPKGVMTKYATSTKHYGSHKAVATVNNGERYPRTVLPSFSNGHGGVAVDHPTQKPLELLCYLVKTYSNPGDLVIDPFSGSGTTGAACILTGRDFKGCEISPEYHRVATRRLEAVAAQSQLFEVTV